MYEQMLALIANKFLIAPDRMTPDSTLAELGLDSLDVVELALLLETEYEVPVTDDDLYEAGRLQGVVSLVVQRRAEV